MTDDGLTTIEVGDLTFDVRSAGPADGVAVILLHGFPQTSWSWRHQIDALVAAGHRVVAPDQRGYSPGARPSGVRSYALPKLVDDVLGLADHEGFDRFHLVGHDWGAMVAWRLAATHPDRLRSLTTLSVPHPLAFRQALRDLRSGQAARSYYAGLFQIPGIERAMLAGGGAGFRKALGRAGLSADEVDHTVEALGTRDALGAALNWYRAVRHGGLEGVGTITVPTLHVWSTEDLALSRAGAEATERYVEGPYRFEVLDGVSHWIPEHAAEATNRLLLEQFAAHPG